MSHKVGCVDLVLSLLQRKQEMIKTNPPVDEVYQSLRRGDDSFAHESHVGAVTAVDWSPFHRNLFLSCGVDGIVKLFHVLDQSPLRQWQPLSFVPETVSGMTNPVNLVRSLNAYIYN
jgi:WD40 repeat protein